MIACLLIVCNLVLAMMSGVLGPLWKILWRTMLPLLLFMIPIHGLLNPDNVTPVFTYHSISLYAEGLRFAAVVLVRLAAVITASLLFVLCTHPADCITAATQAGCSPSVAYLLGSPLLILPAMRARAGVIQSAQRARGLDSEGHFFKRMKALKPLVAPFVLGALVEIEQRAIALEVRGFNSRTVATSWRVLVDSKGQKGARWAMLLMVVGIIVWRIVG
ncbi:cobalt ABC transporter permease [Pseudodesulfovibrio sediminis]|uniref:Cobalt ABC transporter permease n=2 Tax=Pseudodesulfovibrio sediminis TaxID=2810563 RepID=A0ABM7P250_9BACT|nr:cobalt ABC transporter permease [Pseudodesulfovibrio sediminis]